MGFCEGTNGGGVGKGEMDWQCRAFCAYRQGIRLLGNGGRVGLGSVLSGSEVTNRGGVERGKWTGSVGLVKLILTFRRVKGN